MHKLTVLALLLLAAGPAAAQDRAIAAVNGDAITAGDITKRLWWQYSAQSLSDAIDERLILAKAVEIKASYDAKEADKRLQNLASGYKNKEEFEAALASVGWTAEDLKALIKRQMLIRSTVLAMKGVTVSDADVKAFFEQNKARLGKADAAKLRQIFTNTRAAADDVKMILDTGADFAKLSSLKSDDENLRKREGAVGEVSRGMLLPDIEKEVFALKPGQYTKPLATGTGFSIFKVEAFTPGEQPKLTEALKADIKATLVNQVLTQKLPELAAELRRNAKIEVFR